MEVATVDKVWALQRALINLPQLELHTTHKLCGGMYAREIFIPAGTIYVGRVHKRDHFFVILSGRSRLTTDGGVQEIEGPQVLEVRAGSKRAGVCLTDCRYVTFHRTDKVDLKDIEDDLVEVDPTISHGVGNKLLPPKETL